MSERENIFPLYFSKNQPGNKIKSLLLTGRFIAFLIQISVTF